MLYKYKYSPVKFLALTFVLLSSVLFCAMFYGLKNYPFLFYQIAFHRQASQYMPSNEHFFAFNQNAVDAAEKPSNLLFFENDVKKTNTTVPSRVLAFRPRRDIEAVNLTLPINWSQDPFGDRNWRMSLNALRIIDPLISKYQKRADMELLREMLAVIIDWEQYHRSRFNLNAFAWYDMSAAYRVNRLVKVIGFLRDSNLKLSASTIEHLIVFSGSHAQYLRDPKYLSGGSHAIFQLSALYRLCQILPEIKQCFGANAWIRDEMEKLILQQYTRDGLHTEHSFGYHFFTLQHFKDLQDEGLPIFTQEAQARLAKAEKAACTLMAPNGYMPAVGDSAEGIKKRQNFKCPIEPLYPHISYFPEGGMAALKTENMALWFYAFYHSGSHKHWEELSFTLWGNGEPLLIDAGKFTYNKNPQRDYFLSREAHNTVIFSTLWGKYLPKKMYGSGIYSAQHQGETISLNGAVLLTRGLEHKREVQFKTKNKTIVVQDNFNAHQKEYGIHFLLAPQLALEKQEDKMVTFSSASNQLNFKLLEGDCKADLQKALGSKRKPKRGWYSPSYHKIEPTHSLLFWCKNGKGAQTQINVTPL